MGSDMGDVELSGKVMDDDAAKSVKGESSQPAAPNLPSFAPSGAPPSHAKVLAADLAQGVDALGIEPTLQPLAELAAHRDSETPFTIGLLGPSGSGKSFALDKLLAKITILSASNRSPFLGQIFGVHIDAGSVEGDPEVALASEVYEKLAAVYPELVHEAAHAVRDPHVVAREAAERLDDGRRRLDAERQSLEEIESRRARLRETVLFDSAGSQVDTYARANRAKIESRLDSFGLSGDAIANYKSLVRDLADSGGPVGRVPVALRAFWAFKGQGRLLAAAAILFLASIAFNITLANQSVWLGWLRQRGTALTSTAHWLEAHAHWLHFAASVAFLGALLALAINIGRGLRFLGPLFRGIGLLESDVKNRRQALDALYAHQMRRVDSLEADVEQAARRAAAAERRASSSTQHDLQAEPSPFQGNTLKTQAERFFSALSNSLKGGAKASSAAPAPNRIIIAIDNVDSPGKGRAFAEAANRILSRPGFVTLLAADATRLAAEGPVERLIHIPFHVGAAAPTDYAAFIDHLVGRGASSVGSSGSNPPSSASAPLDWSIAANEGALLTAVAPLAGASPRAIKRLVNVYRVARSQAPQNKGALAFMLALDSGGAEEEIAAVRSTLEQNQADAAFDIPGSSLRIGAALAAARSEDGSINVGAARRAAAIASIFSLRG